MEFQTLKLPNFPKIWDFFLSFFDFWTWNTTDSLEPTLLRFLISYLCVISRRNRSKKFKIDNFINILQNLTYINILKKIFQIDLNIAFMYLYRREILCWTQKWLQIKSKSNSSHEISKNVTFFEKYEKFSKNVTFVEISWEPLDLDLIWSHFWVQHKISRR